MTRCQRFAFQSPNVSKNGDKRNGHTFDPLGSNVSILSSNNQLLALHNGCQEVVSKGVLDRFVRLSQPSITLTFNTLEANNKNQQLSRGSKLVNAHQYVTGKTLMKSQASARRIKNCKRLRSYVLTCFHRLRTFAFQNPNESKMETKEMVISAQAAKLYERTWARFNQMSSIILTMTLRSLCRDSRVNYCGMQEWMAQHGYAEPERADTGKGRASDPIGTSEENPTFLQLNPVSLPQSMAHDILRQVSITFSEGTVLTLQECSPEGVVSLLDTYARRRSAMEGTCLR